MSDHFSNESVASNDSILKGNKEIKNIILIVGEIKETIVRQRGDTLVIVPCWWDGRINSYVLTIIVYNIFKLNYLLTINNRLAATIKFQRPDLLSHLPFPSLLSPSLPLMPISFCPPSELALCKLLHFKTHFILLIIYYSLLFYNV